MFDARCNEKVFGSISILSHFSAVRDLAIHSVSRSLQSDLDRMSPQPGRSTEPDSLIKLAMF